MSASVKKKGLEKPPVGAIVTFIMERDVDSQHYNILTVLCRMARIARRIPQMLN
jgi:hypothetical protein